MEKLKLWLAAILALGVVYLLGYGELSVAGRFLTAAAGLAAAGALVVFSQSGRDFSRFVRDSGNELRKVVWPGKQEVVQMTGVVFVFLTIASIFLWLVDLVINYSLQQLVR